MHELSQSLIFAAVFALLCWWLGTGVILWLVRRPTHTFVDCHVEGQQVDARL